MATAGFYDRVSHALNGLTHQLNINASRDMEREQMGLRRLQDTQQMMMQLDQQKRAQEAHDANLEQMAYQRELHDEQRDMAKKDFELSLPGKKFQANLYQNAMKPVSVNVAEPFGYDPYITRRLQEDPEFRADAARVFGLGSKIDPQTLAVLNEDGEPLELPGHEASNRLNMLLGVAEMYTNPVSYMTEQSGMISSQLEDLQGRLRDAPQQDVALRASLMKQIATTKSQLGSAQQQLTPMNLLQHLQRKNQWLRATDTMLGANMGDPTTRNHLSQAMAQNYRQIQDLLEGLATPTDAQKTHQKLAFLVREDGTVGGSVWLNPGKETPHGVTPLDVDPQLANRGDGTWMWKEAFTASKGGSGAGSSDQMSQAAALGKLREGFISYDAEGKIYYDPNKELARRNAEGYLKDNWHRIESEGVDTIQLTWEAEQYAKNFDNAYYDRFEALAEAPRGDIMSKDFYDSMVSGTGFGVSFEQLSNGIIEESTQAAMTKYGPHHPKTSTVEKLQDTILKEIAPEIFRNRYDRLLNIYFSSASYVDTLPVLPDKVMLRLQNHRKKYNEFAGSTN